MYTYCLSELFYILVEELPLLSHSLACINTVIQLLRLFRYPSMYQDMHPKRDCNIFFKPEPVENYSVVTRLVD